MAYSDFKRLKPVFLKYGRTFGTKSFLCHEAERGIHLFLILEGRVAVYKKNRSALGKKIVIAEMEQGEFFGELTMFADTPYNATVQALTKVKALVIDEETFNTIIKSQPTFAIAVLKRFSNRLRNCQEYYGEALMV